MNGISKTKIGGVVINGFVLLGQIVIINLLCHASLAQTDDRPVLELLRDLQSDSYKVSQKAADDIQDMCWTWRLESWFQNQNHEAFADEVEPMFDELDALLGHCNRDIVHATLEVIARHGLRGKDKLEIVVELANDPNRHPLIRQQAFRTLCCITPKDVSVFEQLDIGFAFNLYHWEAHFLLPIKDSEKELKLVAESKYTGLSMVAEMVFQAELEPTGHIKSELNALGESIKSARSDCVRVFSLLLLANMEGQAIDVIDVVKSQIEDDDKEIRRVAALVALEIDLTKENMDEVLKLANFDEAVAASFREHFEAMKAWRAAEEAEEAAWAKEAEKEALRAQEKAKIR